MLNSLGQQMQKAYSLGEEVQRIYSLGDIVYEKDWWSEFGNRVPYIESDGNAYIDTGHTLQYDNGVTELGVSVENTNSAASIYGFIERSGSIANRVAIGSTGSGFFVGSGNTFYLTTPTIPDFKYDVVYDRKLQKAWLNGVESLVTRATGTTNTYDAFLFSRNDKGKPDADGTYNLVGKIYYLKEYLEGVPQISLVPIQVKKTFNDKNGVLHSSGDFIMVNELVPFDVPKHTGVFTGIDTVL